MACVSVQNYCDFRDAMEFEKAACGSLEDQHRSSLMMCHNALLSNATGLAPFVDGRKNVEHPLVPEIALGTFPRSHGCPLSGKGGT
jgi:hypothetical protein